MGKIEIAEAIPREIVQVLRSSRLARAAYLGALQAAYDEYREAGGELVALAWASEELDPLVWNELFQAKNSSHVVSLNGLTRADGVRVVRGTYP